MAYATIDEVKTDIGLTDAANVDYDTIERTIKAAEYSINRFCNRPSGFLADTTAAARYYAGRGQPYLLIEECTEITEVAVKDSLTDTTYTAWDTPTSMMAGDGDWLPFSYDPRTPDFNSPDQLRPYTWIMVDVNSSYSDFTSGRYVGRHGFRPNIVERWVPTVKVTAKWGFATIVPPDIKMATIMTAARWYKRLEGAMSDALASPEFGTLSYIQELDPDVKHILYGGRYVRPPV